MIDEFKLERMMQVAQDTKKEFSRSKDTGTWEWFDPYCRTPGEAYSRPFPTFLEALEDAVAPYMEDSE